MGRVIEIPRDAKSQDAVREEYPPRDRFTDTRCTESHDPSNRHRTRCSRVVGHEGLHVGYNYSAEDGLPVALFRWVN